ncbi:MAG TPA: phage holin family protein [Verrucomicrobiae bacterium]|nr:phage holin family protein [Verrucomicrobiae bacterium]
MADSAPRRGIVQSLRNLGRSGVALLQNRIELLGVELEEQKLRLTRLLLLAGAAIFLANIALLAISATIVVLAGEQARLAVLIGLSLIYSGAAVWALLALRKELRSAPAPFQESIAELKKDGDWLNQDPRR